MIIKIKVDVLNIIINFTFLILITINKDIIINFFKMSYFIYKINNIDLYYFCLYLLFTYFFI